MDEHNAVAVRMDFSQQDIKNARAAKMKRLLSQSVLECIKIDHEIGMDVVNSYRETWIKRKYVVDTDFFKP